MKLLERQLVTNNLSIIKDLIDSLNSHIKTQKKNYLLNDMLNLERTFGNIEVQLDLLNADADLKSDYDILLDRYYDLSTDAEDILNLI